MKAILCTRFGGPDDLEFTDLPDPRPAAGDVVVAVRSAALNFFDTLLIATCAMVSNVLLAARWRS